MSKLKAYCITGTHWDREWYYPFQEYRMWLVQTIDHALELMERNDKYICFHLDGQSVIIDDYLAIRPENEMKIVDALKSGKLVAGPWYCQPDEFLVSGESLIRNIHLGINTITKFGASSLVEGYCPDTFGHIASLPDLLCGFGMKNVVLWRGSSIKTRGSHYLWEGVNQKNSLIVTQLTDLGGYVSFWTRVRKTYHSEEELIDKFEAYFLAESKFLTCNCLYLSDASDHLMACEKTPEILEILSSHFKDIEFVHASLQEYFADIDKCKYGFKRYSGDLRDPNRDHSMRTHDVLAHTLSSRYPIKKMNDKCQNQLELWTEPLYAISLCVGKLIPQGYLDLAWKYLIMNHAHDSICGCSIDDVQRDMEYRFRQSYQLADIVKRLAVANLTSPTTSLNNNETNIVIYNPLPYPRDEIVELDISFPSSYSPKKPLNHVNKSHVNQFVLIDENNCSVEYQLISIKGNQYNRNLDKLGRAPSMLLYDVQTPNSDIYKVAAKISLSPCGIRSLKIIPLYDKVYRNSDSMRTAANCFDNGVFLIEIKQNGAIDIKHHLSGIKYVGLMRYEDSGDIGDGWNYAPAIGESLYSGYGQNVSISIENDGPYEAHVRIERTFRLPKSASFKHGGLRKNQKNDLLVIDLLIIRKDCAYLEIKTTVHNNIKDHRLRVLFDTPLLNDVYFSDQPFCFVDRNTYTDETAMEGIERDPPERPHSGIFGISDDKYGLSILCPQGLHEHEIIGNAEKTLALTLFRSYDSVVMTEHGKKSQINEKLKFKYAILPFGKDSNKVSLYRNLQVLKCKTYAHLSEINPGKQSWIEVVGDIIVNNIKPSFDHHGIIIRIWNPTGEEAGVIIRTKSCFSKASFCRLDETIEFDTEDMGREMSFLTKPRSIVTLKLWI